MNGAQGLEQSYTSRCTPQVLATELTGLWRSFIKALFDPYRPERHYMRGPGPGWHGKHGQPAGTLSQPAGFDRGAVTRVRTE